MRPFLCFLPIKLGIKGLFAANFMRLVSGRNFWFYSKSSIHFIRFLNDVESRALSLGMFVWNR